MKNKNNNSTKDNKQIRIRRVNRPIGFTMMATQFHQSQQKQEKNTNLDQTVQNLLLKYIIENNVLYNNKKLTIPYLSQLLNISEQSIYNNYIQYQSGLADQVFNNKGANIPQVILFKAFEKILENEALTSQQLQLLQAAQGNSYKAFISSTVNDSLRLKMQSSTAFMELYKLINPKPGVAIQFNQGLGNNNGTSNPQSDGLKSLGVMEALNLLEAEGITKLRFDENRYLSIKSEHLGSDVPDTKARPQDGFKDAIPLMLPKADPKPTHHEKRRKEETGLDDDLK